MKITKLKINRIENPIGFDLGKPRVSYVVTDSISTKQEFAKVEVALDERFENIVFDSGKKENINSLAYELPVELKAYTRYFFRVTVWGNKGDFATSETAFFETAKLGEKWEAKWISPSFDKNTIPVLRKTSILSKEIKKARVYACGLGLYEMEINGQKAGEEFFAPGCNAYDKWIQYQTYDITSLLKEGANNINVYMGKGWFKGRFGFDGGKIDIYGDNFIFLSEIKIEYVDGTSETILTDSSWKASKSKIVDGDIYDGEILDMTFDDSEEFEVVEVDYGYEKLTARHSIPVKIKEVLKPIGIIKTPKGETIIDIGQNITGWLEFKTQAPKGHEIFMQYGEILQDGCFYNENLREAKAEFKYISDGEKRTVSPKFTFYGFRYVKVENWYDELNLDDFKACVVYSDLEETGEIETGDALVNRLFKNVLWSQKDNFLDIPTDCPQRDERLGWTGDAQVFAGTACFNMDSYAFMSKYCYDLYQEQKDREGFIPMFVPSMKMPSGGSSGWADVATILPWTLYNQYGDKAILEQQFDSMKMWADYIKKQDEELGNKKLWTVGFHFGDWLALDGEGGGNPKGGTEDYYIASIYYFYSVKLVGKTAEILGKNDIAKEYLKLSEEIRKAIVEEYYTTTGRLALKNQTAYVLSLYFEIAPEYKERTIKDLVERLKADKNHLKTGFIGTPYICRVLSENGYNELAYTLLLNKGLPSWLYAVNMGATTIWERWNSVMPDGKMNPQGMNSLNHYAYGAIAEWMYRNMAGINEDTPGFKKAIIRPQADWRIGNANCYLDTVSGKYESLWKITKDGVILIEVTTPFDTETKIILNDAKISDIIINDKKLSETDYIYREEGNNVIITVETGTYFINYIPTKDYKMTYNLEMPLGTLLANKRAKEILEKYWPKMASTDSSFILGKSPLDSKKIPGFGIDEITIGIIDKELKKILL